MLGHRFDTFVSFVCLELIEGNDEAQKWSGSLNVFCALV